MNEKKEKRIKVKYPSGYKAEYRESVAKILIAKGEVKRLRESETREEKEEK